MEVGNICKYTNTQIHIHLYLLLGLYQYLNFCIGLKYTLKFFLFFSYIWKPNYLSTSLVERVYFLSFELLFSLLQEICGLGLFLSSLFCSIELYDYSYTLTNTTVFLVTLLL